MRAKRRDTRAAGMAHSAFARNASDVRGHQLRGSAVRPFRCRPLPRRAVECRSTRTRRSSRPKPCHAGRLPSAPSRLTAAAIPPPGLRPSVASAMHSRRRLAPIMSWAMLPALLRKIFAPRAVPANFKDRFPASLTLRPKQLRAAAEESALLIPEAERLQPLYSSVRCPVHIFHGTGDQLIEPEQARRLHQVLSRSDLHLVDDAGHMVTYADGGTISQTIDGLEEPLRIISRRDREPPCLA
jgi:pimeloyl-ACP methyl ester carboxylesterase